MPESASSPGAEPADRPRLLPVLGLFSAGAIVVGEVIGSGIFFSPSAVASATGGYVGIVLGLWLVCGLVNLCGALSLAELSAMFPQAGGTYVFLRETYGKFWSFLWGWSEFWVIRTGAIATLAYLTGLSATNLLSRAISGPDGFTAHEQLVCERTVALGSILLLGIVNIAGVRWGGAVQNVATAIKVGFVALLAILPFLAARGGGPFDPWWPPEFDRHLALGIGGALAAIMWAYDGWGNVTVVAEEIRDPVRNIPKALVLGVGLIVVLYVGANLAYHLALPAQAIARSHSPLVDVMAVLMPGLTPWVPAILAISTFGALNGNILVGPRVLYAVASDHRELAPLSGIGARTHTPGLAIAAICGWSIVLLVMADASREAGEPLFQILVNYCIFGGSIFYFSAVLAVYVLRFTRPEHPRPYRTWGYPVTPAVFVLFYIFLLATLLHDRPKESLAGLTLVAAGAVAYAVAGFVARRRSLSDISPKR